MNRVLLLGVAVCVLGSVQPVLFYYYLSGAFITIFMVPYMIAGVLMSFVLFSNIVKNYENGTRWRTPLILGAIGNLMALSYFLIDFEFFDWSFRVDRREEIVRQIKAEKLSTSSVLIDMDEFPPISNGGNRVGVEKFEDGSYAITFWIDTGFLDHHSEFVYTDNVDKMIEFEKKISHNPLRCRVMKDNWYRMQY